MKEVTIRLREVPDPTYGDKTSIGVQLDGSSLTRNIMKVACLRKRWETAKNDSEIDARVALNALAEEFSKRFPMHVLHFAVTSMGTYLTAERFFTRKCSSMTNPHILRRMDWPEVAAIVDAGGLIREARGQEFRVFSLKYHDGRRIPE